jgi:hypothetical protein
MGISALSAWCRVARLNSRWIWASVDPRPWITRPTSASSGCPVRSGKDGAADDSRRRHGCEGARQYHPALQTDDPFVHALLQVQHLALSRDLTTAIVEKALAERTTVFGALSAAADTAFIVAEIHVHDRVKTVLDHPVPAMQPAMERFLRRGDLSRSA